MKISVITPVFNGAGLLSRAIESVRSQTFTDWELIIVDDGSVDNTKSVAESFVAKDPRIKYLFCQHSGGPARPLNAGIKISEGDFIAILEQDDEWMPEKLELQVGLFMKRKDLCMVGCEVFVANEISGKRKKVIFKKNKNSAAWFRSMIEDRDFFFNLSTLLISKTRLVDSSIFFDERLSLSADRDFYIRMIPQGFDVVTKPLVVYHSHTDSLSKNPASSEKIIQDTLLILEKHRPLFKAFPRGYSLLLGYVGILLYCDGRKNEAWLNLKNSIKIYPFNLKLYAKIAILVLFGPSMYFQVRNYYFSYIKIR